MGLKQIQIVLVRPEGPLNLGSIARVMKNFGLANLILVQPQCDRHSPDAQKMAVHAKEILAQARDVASLPEALVGCQRAIATTVRERITPIPLETPEVVFPWLLEVDEPTALVFGAEASGLSNADLQLAQRWLRIPTHPDSPTLNLAQAVALCCYELFRQQSLPPPAIPPKASAPLDAMEDYLAQMAALLLDIGYLYPHTRQSRMAKFRQLLHRSNPSPSELALLRGVLHQMEWALKNTK